eukprot:194689-Hanusia_phi.AAC.1
MSSAQEIRALLLQAMSLIFQPASPPVPLLCQVQSWVKERQTEIMAGRANSVSDANESLEQHDVRRSATGDC